MCFSYNLSITIHVIYIYDTLIEIFMQMLFYVQAINTTITGLNSQNKQCDQ